MNNKIGRQCKVNVAVVDAEKVREMCAKHSVQVAADAPLAERVAALEAWYVANTPKNRIADCSTCGGESDVQEPCCPYCGDGDTAPAPAPVLPSGTSGKLASAPESAPAPASTPKAAPKPAPAPVAPASPPSEPAADMPPVLPNGLVRLVPGMARPLPPPPPPEVIEAPPTLDDLNAAVARAAAYRKDTAQSIWELGRELGDIYDRSLWRLRVSEDGAERYKSWGQFCEAELGLSHGYSLRLIDVAREFTRDDVAAVGSTKLMVTLSVTKEHRPALLEQAKAGASVRDLKTTAQTLPQAPQGEARGTKGGAGAHRGPKKQPPPPPTKKITVAMVEKRVELIPKNDKGAPLLLKVQRPYVAEERMFNGVRQRVILSSDEDGVLIVTLERSRE